MSARALALNTEEQTINFASMRETMGLSPSRAWFAVFVRSHHEKRVAQQLQLHEVENFLPLYSEIHQWANRTKATVELPLFPNYIFVRMNSTERRRVLEVPGILSIVGYRSQAAVLPDPDIEALRAGLHLRKFEPHSYLVVGERVRIHAGPLEGMEGILLRRKNDFRVVISIAQIMQSVAVEVDICDVEPASGHNTINTISLRQ
jgi:transcription antitermination factor NusG